MKKIILSIAMGLVGMTTYAQTIPSYVPTNGLVGWWPFNGNANDESGNGNDGVVNGPTLTNDRFGLPNKAYSFDGVNDLINFINNTNLNVTGDITISCCVVSNHIFSQQQLVWFGDSQYEKDPYSIAINSSNEFYFRKDILTGNFVTQLNYQPNNTLMYNHIVGVYNSSDTEMKMYINGLLVDSVNLDCSINYNTQNMFLNFGGVDNGSGPYPQFFRGDLDDIGIWNRGLTDTEILNLYNATNGNISSSVGVTELNNGVNLLAYPNPAETILQIKINPNLIGQKYKLYDSFGKVIMFGDAVNDYLPIDVSNLPNGVYIFNILNESVLINH